MTENPSGDENFELIVDHPLWPELELKLEGSKWPHEQLLLQWIRETALTDLEDGKDIQEYLISRAQELGIEGLNRVTEVDSVYDRISPYLEGLTNRFFDEEAERLGLPYAFDVEKHKKAFDELSKKAGEERDEDLRQKFQEYLVKILINKHEWGIKTWATFCALSSIMGVAGTTALIKVLSKVDIENIPPGLIQNSVSITVLSVGGLIAGVGFGRMVIIRRKYQQLVLQIHQDISNNNSVKD